MAREQIGIMGGTFDPIHKGHIAMAKAAREALKLDRVLMIPTGNPPHKHGITPAEDRWRMLVAAVVKEPGLEPCRIELDREGVIYTVDTLTQLKGLYPKADFTYIIGADTLLELKNWHDYTRVLQLCSFAVCHRLWNTTPKALVDEQKRLEALGGRFRQVHMEPVDISSTELRRQLAAGEATPLLPETVREYAGLRGFYGMTQRLPEGEAWLTKLFADLSASRFSHTLAVAYTARHLARAHQLDMVTAETAAILHDCAKCLPVKEMQRICRERSLTEDPGILDSGALMHSIVGASLAASEYGVTDPIVLDAIACHTTGREGMTPMDMVVYLADKIEPTRDSYPLLEKVRLSAYYSLEKAMLMSMEGTEAYVKKGGKQPHPQTMATITWLKQKMKER